MGDCYGKIAEREGMRALSSCQAFCGSVGATAGSFEREYGDNECNCYDKSTCHQDGRNWDRDTTYFTAAPTAPAGRQLNVAAAANEHTINCSQKDGCKDSVIGSA